MEKQRIQYQAAVDALSDPQRTRLVLVARAQAATLREAARTHDELAAIGLSQQHLVINGVLDANAAGSDPLAQAIVVREQAAMRGMPESLKALPRDDLPLKPLNLQTAVAGSAERRNASIGAAFRAIPGTAEQFQMGDRPSSGILRRSSNLANFDGANCRF